MNEFYQVYQELQDTVLKGKMKLKDLYEWIDGLPEAHLESLSTLLTIIFYSGADAAATANYWRGVLSQEQKKYGVNPWGEDIATEQGLQQLLESPDTPLNGPESL